MDGNLTIIIIFIFVGALEILMGMPLMYGKIKPNWFYGFRLPKTVSNKEIWYKVNKQTGRDFIISGMIIVIVSLFLMVFNLNFDVVAIATIQVFILMALMAIMIVRGLLLIKKLYMSNNTCA